MLKQVQHDEVKKKAGSYLLSRNESSIIDVRELDFRVRNGNGYYLSTMATGIINNASYEVRKSDFSEHTGRIFSKNAERF